MIYLPTSRDYHSTRSVHRGYNSYHKACNEMMRAELDKLGQLGQSGDEKWTSKQYHDAMQDLINRERKNLRTGKTRIHCEGYKMSYFRLLASYKRDVYFFYSDENQYNRFDLEKGIPYSQNEKLLYVVDRFDSYLEKYDILPTVGGKLVSLKLKKLIEGLGSDCEFIPAIIKSTETGEINDSFFVMNVLNLIPCLDHNSSDYEPLVKSMPNGPISLNFIAFIPESLNGYHVVRMKESKEEIVVDEVFVDACRKEKIKGVMLVKEGNVRSPEFVDLK